MTPSQPLEPSRSPGHRLPRTRAEREVPRQPQGPTSRRVGRFEIVDKIGEGGMGVVYRAVDTADPARPDVAVKVLRPHIAYDPDARTRLAREVETLERVHSPSVAAVIDADPFGERPYIATEYVPGTPLDEVVKERGPFGPEAMARLGRDLADAITAIHDAGVIHRDLKPSNVLMVGDRPVVIDFGIAHIADDARLTSTGLVMGTPGYLSPELVEGAPVSASTDWWGWAATLAFAAQGQPPFGRGPMPVVLDRVTRGQSNLSGVDARLRPLLLAALSPVPSERPSAHEVVAQMERYSRGEPTTVVPVRSADVTTMLPRPEPDSTSVMPRADATRRQPQSVAPVRPQANATQGYRQHAEPQFPDADAQPYRPQPRESQTHESQPRRHDPQARPAQGQGPAYAPMASNPQRVKPQSRPGEHDPRINLPSRSGTLQALFVLWLGLTALLPVVGLLTLVAWNVAARFSDSTITQTVLRRYEAGRRRSDGAVAVASSPWHVVRAVVSTLFALVLPAIVFACVAALTGIGWAAVHGGVARVWWALPLVVGAAAAQMTLWRGAGSVGYRRGSRSLVRGIVPGSAATIGAAVAAGLGLFMVLGSFMQAGDISWFPLTGGFSDPLSTYAPGGGY